VSEHPSIMHGPSAEQPDGEHDTEHPAVRRVGRRRVQTAAVAGSDAQPQSAATLSPGLAVVRAAEDTDDTRDATPPGAGPNDERLKADKPPHW
jgi:high-mobility group nucleosome-binding domain-containing protein 2